MGGLVHAGIIADFIPVFREGLWCLTLISCAEDEVAAHAESAGDRCRSSAEDVQAVEEDRGAALDDGSSCEGKELHASGEARQGHAVGGFDRPVREDVANGAEEFSLQIVGFKRVVSGAETFCDEWRDSGVLITCGIKMSADAITTV